MLTQVYTLSSGVYPFTRRVWFYYIYTCIGGIKGSHGFTTFTRVSGKLKVPMV